MKKVKLFRKGRLVGLVQEDFHQEKKKVNLLWENLGINNLY
mgnify:CR=1 FL=1|jgi:hypothetical protein